MKAAKYGETTYNEAQIMSKILLSVIYIWKKKENKQRVWKILIIFAFSFKRIPSSSLHSLYFFHLWIHFIFPQFQRRHLLFLLLILQAPLYLLFVPIVTHKEARQSLLLLLHVWVWMSPLFFLFLKQKKSLWNSITLTLWSPFYQSNSNKKNVFYEL